jgi:hypothetical protein
MENQGSNFKREVMEALDSVPANRLSGSAFKWAASHLPDEGKDKGSYQIKVPSVTTGNLNHNQDSILDVFGFDDERMCLVNREIAEIIKDAVVNHNFERNSETVEFVISKSSDELKQVLFIQGVTATLKQASDKMESDMPPHVADALKKLQALLRSMKGNSED